MTGVWISFYIALYLNTFNPLSNATDIGKIFYDRYNVISNARAFGGNITVNCISLLQCVVYCKLNVQCRCANYLSSGRRCEMLLLGNVKSMPAMIQASNWKYVVVISEALSSTSSATLATADDGVVYGSTVSPQTTSTMSPKPRCPPGFEELGSGCYYFERKAGLFSLASAKTICFTLYGAYLASLETNEEFTLLQKYLLNIYPTIASECENGWLVNAKRINRNRQFSWYTGGVLSLVGPEWADNKPGSNLCVAMYPPNLQYNDIWCTSMLQQFICEA